MRTALLGGELGDWLGKRRRLEAPGIRTLSAYATADFGLIGFEEPGHEGYDSQIGSCRYAIPSTASRCRSACPARSSSPRWPADGL